MFGLQLAKTSPVFNRSDFLVVTAKEVFHNKGSCIFSNQVDKLNKPGFKDCEAENFSTNLFSSLKTKSLGKFPTSFDRKSLSSLDDKVVKNDWKKWKDYFCFLLTNEHRWDSKSKLDVPRTSIDIWYEMLGKSVMIKMPNCFDESLNCLSGEYRTKALRNNLQKEFQLSRSVTKLMCDNDGRLTGLSVVDRHLNPANRGCQMVSVRHFHTSKRLNDQDWEQFNEQKNEHAYLQPAKSSLSIAKLARRAGFDMKTIPDLSTSRYYPKKNILFRLLERDKKDRELQEVGPTTEKTPTEPEEKVFIKRRKEKKEKADDAPLSIIRQLSLKQEAIRKQKLLKARQEEDVFLNARKFHNFTSVRPFMTSSAVDGKENKGKSKAEKEDILPPVCSGCQGIAQAVEDFDKPRGPIYCGTRAAGKCKGAKRAKPHPDSAKLWKKCRVIPYGRCRQPREVKCEVERDYGISCMKKQTPQKKKFHTSAATQSLVAMAEEPKSGRDEEYCPWTPAKRYKKQEYDPSKVPPRLPECPRAPGQKRKDCEKIRKAQHCVPQTKSAKTYICQIAGFLGVGCGRKHRPSKK
ncbi:uncharacterized protein LOC106665937 isoform X2 [Cimex lectularius]|uniref:Uncharacterized protein n=1 Tax=Cimex lectularius TaxID=79782 RepID=A0A8I6RQV2_CIMLE|nr:uncharacterized protein LOC106665937 isoform X2 [Cimex lectularius]